MLLGFELLENGVFWDPTPLGCRGVSWGVGGLSWGAGVPPGLCWVMSLISGAPPTHTRPLGIRFLH